MRNMLGRKKKYDMNILQILCSLLSLRATMRKAYLPMEGWVRWQWQWKQHDDDDYNQHYYRNVDKHCDCDAENLGWYVFTTLCKILVIMSTGNSTTNYKVVMQVFLIGAVGSDIFLKHVQEMDIKLPLKIFNCAFPHMWLLSNYLVLAMYDEHLCGLVKLILSQNLQNVKDIVKSTDVFRANKIVQDQCYSSQAWKC